MQLESSCPQPKPKLKKRIGYRIFLVSGDQVSLLTKTAFEEFYFKRQAVLQAFAGKTIDIATVVCRLENTKLTEIVRIYCQRFRVKGDGSIDEERTPRPSGAAAMQRDGTRRSDAVNDTENHLNEKRLTHTLTMISSVAQKKIFEVLRK